MVRGLHIVGDVLSLRTNEGLLGYEKDIKPC